MWRKGESLRGSNCPRTRERTIAARFSIGSMFIVKGNLVKCLVVWNSEITVWW
jgi:hypothetical protein